MPLVPRQGRCERWEWKHLRSLVVGFLLFLVAGGGSAVPASAVEVQTEAPLPKLFIISFNRWGEVSNPAEVALAKREIAADPNIDRIVIFSYGWSNDGESSYATYYELLKELASHAPADRPVPRSVVIAVGWDSAQSGFRKLFNDIMPFPALATLASSVPDLLLFPVSFWSKAATADRIGFGGLREALNEIFTHAFPNGEGTPDVFLAGHSFGTRIVSQLMQDKVVFMPVSADPFVGRDYVRGAMLMQPAISQGSLHRDAEYPILVTQSEHDHAVGGLFPVANLLVNTSTFTSFEALFRYRFHDATDVVAEPTRRMGRGAVDILDSDGTTVTGSVVRTGAKVVSRSGYMALRAGAELLSVPVALFSGVLTTPINYLYVQGHGLSQQPGTHIMDSFAQLPVLEIGVDMIGNWAEPEIPWGQRGKGFFNLGALNESVGRLRTPALVGDIPSSVYTLEEIQESRRDSECGLPRCSGIVMVDATDFIETGVFGGSYNQPRFDYTVGWIDPLGSHSDYKNETVVELLANFFDAASTHHIEDVAPEAPDGI